MLKYKSKIGQAVIKCPASVTCTLNDNMMTVSGPKGLQSFKWNNQLGIKCENEILSVFPLEGTEEDISAIWGTMRSILASYVDGVQNEHKKTVTLSHVGYKAKEIQKGEIKMIEFTLGKSTKSTVPVQQNSKFYDTIKESNNKNVYQQDYLPKEIFPNTVISVVKPTELLITSISKELLGAAIARIKSLRKQKFYKGPRIIAEGDFIIKRVVKQTK